MSRPTRSVAWARQVMEIIRPFILEKDRDLAMAALQAFFGAYEAEWKGRYQAGYMAGTRRQRPAR